MMSVKIGHASLDENRNISGGKTGDQTKVEICIRDWYSKPWNIYLECTDEALADSAASWMEQICKENGFGYDQLERLTGYTNLVKNGKKVKGTKGEFDCSSLVSACYKLAGLNINVSNTTLSLKKALLATGKFIGYTDMDYLESGRLSKRGGIYLREGKHVAMVTQNTTSKKSNPYLEPQTVVNFGDTGTGVKWVQWELNEAGYKVKMDAKFGSETEKATRDFQEKNGLLVDGKVGPITRKEMRDN